MQDTASDERERYRQAYGEFVHAIVVRNEALRKLSRIALDAALDRSAARVNIESLRELIETVAAHEAMAARAAHAANAVAERAGRPRILWG